MILVENYRKPVMDMSDIKLFSVHPEVRQMVASEVLLERDLQTLIENNMDAFFGVRFLKSEYVITNGRMDSIGIDENNCPVIFEYKRSSNENVINQGLFYLDWLLDHKADFQLLVADILGQDTATSIDWSMPCVICIASGFTKYDLHAVNQMQRNIKLVRYQKYGNDLVLFEHLNAPAVPPIPVNNSDFPNSSAIKKSGDQKAHLEKLSAAPRELQDIYHSLCDYIESLGDDIVPNQLKLYLAYRKTKNIICIEIFRKMILLHLKINPDDIELEDGFTRDMRNIGHYGTGDLQVTIRTAKDYEKAKPLLNLAYNEAQ